MVVMMKHARGRLLYRYSRQSANECLYTVQSSGAGHWTGNPALSSHLHYLSTLVIILLARIISLFGNHLTCLSIALPAL